MKTSVAAGLGLALLGVAGTGGWLLNQNARLGRAMGENQELRAELARLPGLQEELERLKKVDVDRAELARLKKEEAAKAWELAQLRGRLGAVLRSQQEQAGAKTAAGSGSAGGGRTAANADGGMGGAVADWLTSSINLNVDAQVARARERLQLTPEQETDVRAKIDAALKTGGENLKKVQSGQARPEDVPTTTEWAKALEQELLSGLSADQQAAYHRYKREDIQANARLIANGELLSMQSSLGLSQDQQDQVFGALFDYSVGQLDPDPAVLADRPRNPLAAAEWDNARKLKALEPVLGPQQLDTYRRMQENQIQFWRALAGKGKK